MKDIYKNPNLYYILVPVVIALWPLLVWAVYLPRAERNLDTEIEQYDKAQANIEGILSLDADRIHLADAKTGAAEFDYVNEVYRIAALSGIPQSKCKINSGMIMPGEQKSQGAKVNFSDIDIVKFARFLSTIQLRWANLQCMVIRLSKNKNLPDSWNIDLDFKYYY
jgi:cytochrome oxidase assembly protein ShyY1